MLSMAKRVAPTGPEGLISPQEDIVSSFWNVIFGRVSNVAKKTANHICLSIHKDQFGFSWTDLPEIMYRSFRLKSVTKK